MNVYAHRGASKDYPENTLVAFRRAMELGAFGIELDVHLSKDGVPVVIHDATVDRTMIGSGAVADMTLEDLSELGGVQGGRIPTLEDVLQLVQSQCHVDIEVKAAAAAEMVIHATGRKPGLRWAMSSFDHDVLRFAHSVSPEIELWPLATTVDNTAIKTARELSAPVLALNEAGVTRHTVEALRAEGLGVWAWTVNDPERARILASWGVHGLCTDDPGAILAVARAAGAARADRRSGTG